MPLESGITIPTTDQTKDSHLQFIQDFLAYSENVSLLVINSDLSVIDEALQQLRKEDSNALNDALDSKEEQRTKVFAVLARIPNIRKIMELVELQLYSTNFSYLNALFRLLRDHHYYSWYEALILIRALKGATSDEPSFIDIDLFAKHRVLYAVSKIATGSFLITGPVVLEAEPLVEGQFQNDVQESLTRFNNDISKHWGGFEKHSQTGYDLRGRAPIHSIEYLSQHAFLRQKTHLDDLKSAHQKIVCLYTNLAGSDVLRSLRDKLPIHMYGKLIAAASALYDLAIVQSTKHSGQIVVKKVAISGSSSLVLCIDHLGNVTVSRDQQSGSAPTILTYFIERALDRTYTNWQSYNYESFDLLRNWLNNKFGYISRFAKSATDQPAYADFGMRICRFLARLFRSDECTIYRVDYQSPARTLVRQGSFINRPDFKIRQGLMNEHMTNIASTENDRLTSISYRAIDSNRTRYCRFALKRGDVDKAFDPDTSLAHPDTDEIKNWGVSATAVPIPVQGVPWGVIELISDHPHHFSNAARAKLENIASILCPSFYFQSVFDAIERTGMIVNEAQLSFEGRKTQLLAQLLDVFLCKAVAIIAKESVQPSQSKSAGLSSIRPIRLFGFQGEWWFTNTATSVVPKAELMPFGNIPLDPPTYYWACNIGGSDFSKLFPSARKDFVDAHFGDTLLILHLSQEQNARKSDDDFLLALIMRKEVIIDIKLIELFAFFGKFLLPTVDSFYTHENWERVLRNRLGHELTKILKNMDSTQRKLEGLPQRGLTFGSEAASALYTRLVDDTKKHARSVRVYSEILSRSRDSIAFRNDPEVYMLQQRMIIEGTSHISLRNAYSGGFMSRSSEFKNRNILVDVFPDGDVRIRSHEWLLRDVMQTLADNVLKYAVGGRNLEVSLNIDQLGRILLTISNLAPALTPEDEFRLFSEGGRGTYAKSKKGQGIGLFLARRMMTAAGYDLRHKQRSYERAQTEAGFPVLWHDFILEFPGEILVSQQHRAS